MERTSRLLKCRIRHSDLRGLFALNRRVEAIHILGSQFGSLLTRISQRDLAKATKTKVAPSAVHLNAKDPAFSLIFANNQIEPATICVPASISERSNCLCA